MDEFAQSVGRARMAFPKHAALATLEDRSLDRFLALSAARAAESRRKGCLTMFVSDDYRLAWDWFRAAWPEHLRRRADTPGLVDFVPKGTGWPAIVRRQREWHREMELIQRKRYAAERRQTILARRRERRTTWSCAVGATALTINGEQVRVIPLTSGLSLHWEGREMRHCVAGYVGHCKSSKSRIFRLERGHEKATLEIVRTQANRWSAPGIRAGQRLGFQSSEASRLGGGEALRAQDARTIGAG
ncbi:MAG: PcfJ domain-containing protein [Betaproteobacteria bacterium]|nr:PcfJ domain-containing protein [Betaproteobacteria bacterium]